MNSDDLMLFEGALVPVRKVELIKRQTMRRHDRMPRCLRDCANAMNWTSTHLRSWAKRYASPNAAARAFMSIHKGNII